MKKLTALFILFFFISLVFAHDFVPEGEIFVESDELFPVGTGLPSATTSSRRFSRINHKKSDRNKSKFPTHEIANTLK